MKRPDRFPGPRSRAAAVCAVALLALPPLAAGAGGAAPEAGAPGPSDKASFRAFNDTIFTLAYDVFLAARNLKDAYNLAQEAVRQRPDLIPWRERLARTAEWAGNPVRALQEWEHVYARNGRSESYREAIRLSASLRDHAAAVRAWEGLARVRELDPAEWASLLEAYENSGEPGRGIDRLRARLAARPDRNLSEKLVDVLQRTGRDQEALQTLENLAARYGNSPSIGLRRAQILCRRGRIREAAAALDAIKGKAAAGPEHAALRRLEAATYTWMQRYGEAMGSYRTLYEGGAYDLEDLRGLFDLARDRDPDLALRAAVTGWRKFKYTDFLVYYLEQCIGSGRWDLASRALSRLSPEEWTLFLEVPYFFSLAARIHQHDGREGLARRAYQHALRLDPASVDFQAGYLWLLIDQGRMSDLEIYAKRWDRGARNPRALLEPLAMAYKLLHRNRPALEYFRLLDKDENRTELPFLLGYAELLEQAGDGRGAARLYLRARSVLSSPPAPGEDRTTREWREAMARWSWKFGGSDETGRRMDALMASYAGGEGSKELVFSWRVGRGQNPEDAMAALQSGVSAGEKDFPAWARLAVAMRTNDQGKVADLLDHHEATLGSEDKARAAAYLGRRKDAVGYANQASEGLRSLPAGAGLLGLQGEAKAGAGADLAFHPHYEEQRATVGGQASLGSRTMLLFASETRRRPWTSGKLTSVPDREDAGRLTLRREGIQGSTRLSLGVRSTREALRGGDPDPVMTAAAEQEWRMLREISLTLGYERNEVAGENPVLALTGQRNRWMAELRLALPAQSRAELSAALSSYHDWGGRGLGESAIFKSALERRLLRFLALGAGLAYNSFSPAALRPGPGGVPLVGGILPANEFPQSFWHGSGYLEWLQRTPVTSSWWPSPFASVEAGRNYFPPSGSSGEGIWANEFALRGGISLLPAFSQRLVVMGSYASGLHRRNEIEAGLSAQYEWSFK